MFAIHTIQMPDGGGPSVPDRLTLASVLGLPYGAAANSLGTVGSLTAGSNYTIAPTVTPTGGVLNAAAPGGAYQQAGGWAAVLRATLKCSAATVLTAGVGVAINDTFGLVGGTLDSAAGVQAVAKATNIQAVSAVVNAGGSGGTNGAVTITGTTGTGTKFQATGTIVGNALVGPLTITVAGNYTVGPTSLTSEPITGGSLTGATVTLQMGALTLSVLTAGVYQSVPPTTAVSNIVGTGTGVTITSAFNINAVSIDDSGNYSTIPTGFTVANATGDSTGSGGALAAGAATATGAAVFRAVGPFPNDGIPPSYGIAALSNASPANDETALSYKVTGYAVVKIQPAVVANTVVAGTLDALIWA